MPSRQERISNLLDVAHNITAKLESLSRELELKESMVYKRVQIITSRSNFIINIKEHNKRVK